jgi:hypothetical protein
VHSFSVSIGAWAITIFGGWSVASNSSERINNRGEAEMPEKAIEKVLEEHTEMLMSIPGVVGTAQGLCPNSEPCIKVFVIEKKPGLKRNIPDAIEGYPVMIEETGEFRAR